MEGGRGAPNGARVIPVQIEYLGFKSTDTEREYQLRVRRGPEVEDLIVAIKNEAFLAKRVRYQDGPEVCFLKVQRELAAGEGALPRRALRVSDEELQEYRVAHTPRTPGRRS